MPTTHAPRWTVLPALALLLAPLAAARAQAPEEPLEAPVLLRYAPPVAAPAEYAVAWRVVVEVPLTGIQTLEGAGRLAVVALPAPEGQSLLRVTPSGLLCRLVGEEFVLTAPVSGITVRLDAQGRVLAVEPGEESSPFLGTILRVFFAATMPADPVVTGARWAWPIPSCEDFVSGYEYYPPKVRSRVTGALSRTAVDPPPAPAPKGGIKQCLAARTLDGIEPIAAVISTLPVAIDLSDMPLGRGGDALLSVQAERLERTGELRRASGTGNGRLRRVVLPSLEVEELTVTIARIDPTTGSPVEPLGSYEMPPIE